MALTQAAAGRAGRAGHALPERQRGTENEPRSSTNEPLEAGARGKGHRGDCAPPRTQANHIFQQFGLKHSLGYLNQPFGDPAGERRYRARRACRQIRFRG